MPRQGNDLEGTNNLPETPLDQTISESTENSRVDDDDAEQEETSRSQVENESPSTGSPD